MAEAGQQQTQGQQAQGQGQSQGDQGQGTTGAEPKWLAAITDENLRKEAREGWLRQDDYTRKTQEVAEQRKNWEKEREGLQGIEKWFKENYTPWYQKYGNAIEKNWDKVLPVLTGQQVAALQQQAQQQTNGDDQARFANWDVLPPEEQAKRITDHVLGQLTNRELKALEEKLTNGYTQLFNQGKTYFDNYLQIMLDAQERSRKNPDFDTQAYLQKALEIQYGKANPFDLAASIVTAEPDRKRLEQEWYERGKNDAEQAFLNQQQTNGSLRTESVPIFKQTPQTRTQVSDAVRKLAVEKGFGWG